MMMEFLFSTTEGILAIIVAIAALVAAYLYVSPRKAPVAPAKLSPAPLKSVATVNATPKKAEPIKKKEPEPEFATPNSMKILYGSQTGTAEEFAKTLAGEAKRHGFVPRVVDLEDFKPEEGALKREVGGMLVFMIATYGDGEPTDNAKAFHDWLIDEVKTGSINGEEPFKGIRFTVFGLGNKTYQHYNAMGKVFFKRCKELGGEVLYEMGLGDDDGSLEEDFNKWKSGLWATLSGGGDSAPSAEEETEHKRRLIAVYSDGVDLNQSSSALYSSPSLQRKAPSVGYDAKAPKTCRVLVNRELHSSESDRSCRHVEIDLGDLVYEAGDHLGIFPQNDEEIVAALAPRLGINDENGLNRVITLVTNDQEKKVELGPCTIRQALLSLTDLTSPPRKTVLKSLAFYATNPEEKKKLESLAASDDKQPADFNYNKFIRDDYRSLSELVVYDFPSIQISIDAFLEIAPKMQPRFYSISSSPSEHGNVVHVTAVVTEFQKPTGRKHKGVCTTWLRTKKTSETVPVFVRKSSFKLPQDINAPILMIGPGTGLAPFRGFIYERKHQAKKANTKGQNFLFFGCRHPDIDYLYKDELQSHHEEDNISLNVAFSRLGNQKVYVQHMMRQQKEQLCKLLKEPNLHIYICGEAKAMAKDVHKVLVELTVENGFTEKQAEDWLANLSKNGRYMQDVW